jgi:hypothetical protein
MRIVATISLVFFIAITLSDLAFAAPAVFEVDSIDGSGTGVTSLQSLSPPSTTTVIHLASYHCIDGVHPCQSDGGEGLLVRGGTGCTTSSSDGGSIFCDQAGNFWRRENLNGDLRQWGITYHSDYDVVYMGPSASPVSDIITNNVKPALIAAGIQTIHTSQISILLDKAVIIPAGWSFTCDTPPVKRAHNAN